MRAKVGTQSASVNGGPTQYLDRVEGLAEIRGGKLSINGQPVEEIAAKFDGPLYVSIERLDFHEQRIARMNAALAMPPKID